MEKPILIFGVFRDITERKKLEEELHASEKQHRALLNSISDGVYQCKPGIDGVFTYINLAGAEILGYSSPDRGGGHARSGYLCKLSRQE